MFGLQFVIFKVSAVMCNIYSMCLMSLEGRYLRYSNRCFKIIYISKIRQSALHKQTHFSKRSIVTEKS